MNSRNRGLVLVSVIALVAVVGVVAIIALGNSASKGVEIDFSAIPQSRGEDGAFILGDPNAPVTLIEFADFNCPHCVDYEPTISQFIQQYVATGLARLEYRMFPTAGGDLTRFAGQIAECAEEQQAGSFWKAYPLLYDLSRTGQYTEDLGQRIANELGLSYATLLNCSANAEQVDTDVAFGRAQGVSGTPALLMRDAEGNVQYITVNGQTYDRGAVALDVLAQMVLNAQAS